jgi:hypothetical protein
MATTLSNSIMVQISQLCMIWNFEWCHCEKQILFLAASPFGISDPLFGLYDVYIYHHAFIWTTCNFRFRIIWITVIMDGFWTDQWNNIDGRVSFTRRRLLNRFVEQLPIYDSRPSLALLSSAHRTFFRLPCRVACIEGCNLCILRVL